MRRLLIIGANSAIIKRHVNAAAKSGSWLGGTLTRKPPMLVRVALANKMARIVWALMARGGVYKAPATAVLAVRAARTPKYGKGSRKRGREQFGAIVVRRDRENQCATECLRARGFDLDPIFEHHTGPRQV